MYNIAVRHSIKYKVFKTIGIEHVSFSLHKLNLKEGQMNQVFRRRRTRIRGLIVLIKNISKLFDDTHIFRIWSWDME